MSSIPSFRLLDGSSIPWLGLGNGTGGAKVSPVQCGKLAVESGLLHLDTAQIYKTETETGEAIKISSVNRDEVHVTTNRPKHTPVPLDEVRGAIQESIDRLGFVPNLFLIHSPFVAETGKLRDMWKIFEDLKDEGKLRSIGVSNFRPQDLEAILEGAKYIPVVNQIEYHPYVLAHLEPLLEIHAKHGIVTQSFGILTPTVRHPTGGPLKPVLERIAQNISQKAGVALDTNAVLLLWARAQGVVVVTAGGSPERIAELRKVASLPDILSVEDVEEISRVGKGIYYRHYAGMMVVDFPIPNLPNQ